MSKPKKLEPHALGAIFPPLNDPEYGMLLKSIEEDGYDANEKIVLFEGKILDGNNRYTACLKLGVDPIKEEYTREFHGDAREAIQFVVRKNLARRNLTPSQTAAIGAEMAESLKTSPEEDGARGGRGNKGLATLPTLSGAREKAAAATGSSPRSVGKAMALKKSDPEAFEQVKGGKTTLNAASKKPIKEKKAEESTQAIAIINKVVGNGFGVTAEEKLTHRDLVQYSGLEENEMRRIIPYISEGWKLDAALSYKSTPLTKGHSIRQLIERAVEHGTINVDFGEWEVIARRKIVPAAPIKILEVA